MNAAMSFNVLELSAYGVAAGSSYWEVAAQGTLLDNALQGTQAFAIFSLFDKALRYLLVNNTQAAPTPLTHTLLAPIVEEIMYSGILLTESTAGAIPRIAISLITGMTAARALTGKVSQSQNQEGFTLDTKIGFLWAISRELLLQSAPTSTSSLVLNAIDSCIFALSEVTPTKEGFEIPLFSSPWKYKVIKAAVFRFTTNSLAKTNSITASIAKHLLYNICNYKSVALNT